MTYANPIAVYIRSRIYFLFLSFLLFWIFSPFLRLYCFPTMMATTRPLIIKALFGTASLVTIAMVSDISTQRRLNLNNNSNINTSSTSITKLNSIVGAIRLVSSSTTPSIHANPSHSLNVDTDLYNRTSSFDYFKIKDWSPRISIRSPPSASTLLVGPKKNQ